MSVTHFKTIIALLAVWMLTLASCGTRNVESAIVYDSLEWRDSVVLESGASARVELACVFPNESGTVLADSIRLWILEQFEHPEESADSQNNQRDEACNPTEDIAKSIRMIGQKLLEGDAAEVKELDEFRGGDYPINYERDAKVSIAYDDEQYTTLSFTYYVYLAGAHGSTFVNHATFRKSDGHQMDWDLIEGMSREELTEAIKRGLCGYFGVSMDELPSCLLFNTIDEDESRRVFREDFPLPTTPPYLTADGVSIIYQQYEIACYAAGMPTCIVKRTTE